MIQFNSRLFFIALFTIHIIS